MTATLAATPFATTRPLRTTRSTRHSSAAHHPDFDKQDRILRAAADLVADGGFTAVTARNIAELTGLASGAVNAEVGDTGLLRAGLFHHLAGQEFAAVQEGASDDGHGTPRSAADRLTAVVAAFTRRALGGGQLTRAMLFEPAGPLVEHERLTYRRRYHGLVSTIINEGVHTGELPPQCAELSARAVIGAVTESLLGRRSPAPAGSTQSTESAVTDCSDGELVDQVTGFCLRAVGA